MTSPEKPYSAPTSNPSLVSKEGISEQVIEQLRLTRGWVLFIAGLGYLACCLTSLSGLFMLLGLPGLKENLQLSVPDNLTAMGALYITLGLLYLFPCIKLHKYSKAIKRLIETESSLDLAAALDQQRSFWKFCGILAILMILLYLSVLIFAGFLLSKAEFSILQPL
ncbi:DUF5362 family protein [Rubritalea tangerina]